MHALHKKEACLNYKGGIQLSHFKDNQQLAGAVFRLQCFLTSLLPRFLLQKEGRPQPRRHISPTKKPALRVFWKVVRNISHTFGELSNAVARSAWTRRPFLEFSTELRQPLFPGWGLFWNISSLIVRETCGLPKRTCVRTVGKTCGYPGYFSSFQVICRLTNPVFALCGDALEHCAVNIDMC